MDILQNLVRVNSLLLRGQYEGAEHVLDSAIAETRELVAENARLKQSLEITNDTMCQIIEDRAQQSPAVEVHENKKIDYWHMKYDELLTKTVTIFDENIVGFLEWYEKNYDSAGGLSADLVAKAWVDSRHLMASSPRITEQDALQKLRVEVAEAINILAMCGDKTPVDQLGKKLCDALNASAPLNKLNGDKNGN